MTLYPFSTPYSRHTQNKNNYIKTNKHPNRAKGKVY